MFLIHLHSTHQNIVLKGPFVVQKGLFLLSLKAQCCRSRKLPSAKSRWVSRPSAWGFEVCAKQMFKQVPGGAKLWFLSPRNLQRAMGWKSLEWYLFPNRMKLQFGGKRDQTSKITKRNGRREGNGDLGDERQGMVALTVTKIHMGVEEPVARNICLWDLLCIVTFQVC